MFLDLCVRHAVGFRDRRSSTKQKRAGLHQSHPSEVSASAPSYFDDFVSGQDQLQPILPDLEGATSILEGGGRIGQPRLWCHVGSIQRTAGANSQLNLPDSAAVRAEKT